MFTVTRAKNVVHGRRWHGLSDCILRDCILHDCGRGNCAGGFGGCWQVDASAKLSRFVFGLDPHHDAFVFKPMSDLVAVAALTRMGIQPSYVSVPTAMENGVHGKLQWETVVNISLLMADDTFGRRESCFLNQTRSGLAVNGCQASIFAANASVEMNSLRFRTAMLNPCFSGVCVEWRRFGTRIAIKKMIIQRMDDNSSPTPKSKVFLGGKQSRAAGHSGGQRSLQDLQLTILGGKR